MGYHMDIRSLISVANYLGFLEGKGQIEIAEEEELYGLMEAIDEDVKKADEECIECGFDFWSEVDKAIKRHYIAPTI